MTTQTETTKEKQIPAFYIFDTFETDGKKENKRVGAAFAHKKGTGFSFLINGKRYAAFQPKVKTAAQAPSRKQPRGRARHCAFSLNKPSPRLGAARANLLWHEYVCDLVYRRRVVT
jgi:hypothetical protein